MKISKRDAQLLIGLIGVLAVFLSYQFVFRNFQEKKEAMQPEIVSLESRVGELENIYANIDNYQAGIKEMNQEMTGFYSEFPADIRYEDGIMFVTDMENDNEYMKVSQISFGEAEQIYTVSPTEADTQTEPLETGETSPVMTPVLYKVPLGISHQVTYKGLKEMIAYINENGQSMGIESVSVSYDNTTGILVGSTMIDMFKVTGTNNVYTAPNVPVIPTGSDNIFGTIEVLPDGNEVTDQVTENVTGEDTEE